MYKRKERSSLEKFYTKEVRKGVSSYVQISEIKILKNASAITPSSIRNETSDQTMNTAKSNTTYKSKLLSIVCAQCGNGIK